ncbi:hypothetical protein [Cupriavidus pauculus]|uniref:hypothetical protein n=1 Tax=Cupriavidus pauculus TaxID=82633 RepID=UPI0038575C44
MNQRHQRILSALAECDRFIEREERRDPELRPADVQALLDDYKAHRAKLMGMALEAVRHPSPPASPNQRR